MLAALAAAALVAAALAAAALAAKAVVSRWRLNKRGRFRLFHELALCYVRIALKIMADQAGRLLHS